MTSVGLDIGGTNLKAIAFSSKGQIVAEETTATDDDGSDKWLVRTRELIGSALKNLPASTPVGVAAPGLAARDKSCIVSMPGRLNGLEGLNWQKWLGLDLPVPVLNDAHAALLGENWIGAAKGCSNVVLLTLGTGVGGAVMIDGRLLQGHLGRAGHLGHISLDPHGAKDIVNTPGSLEDAVGEHTLVRRSAGKFQSTRQLVSALQAGDVDAKRVWLTSTQALGVAICGFINLFDPEVVILGGGIADAGETLMKPLEGVLNEFEWRPGGSKVRLVKAELGHRAGAAGVAFTAMTAGKLL
jgi:glucokinase